MDLSRVLKISCLLFKFESVRLISFAFIIMSDTMTGIMLRSVNHR